MQDFVTPGDRLQQQTEKMQENLQRVKHIIAVMSGKGGTGKTTVATNLAALMAARGRAVGILDADIDCPNVGTVLGIAEHYGEAPNGRLLPLEAHGIKVASMAFFEQADDVPLAFRGPIIHRSILQLLGMTEWGVLDFLIIDMPPGTSDAAMTVLQFVPLSGVVIVTTPAELSQEDALRAGRLVRQFGKPFGIVENMTGDVFGKGAAQVAEQLDAPFLGSIPLLKEIRTSCDAHVPAVLESKKVRKLFEGITDTFTSQVLG